MIRIKGKVEYVDGTSDEFECGNAGLAAWERYALRNGFPIGKDSAPMLSSLVIAHHALAIEMGVDAWADTIDGIDLDVEKVPPTQAAPPQG